MKFGKKGQMFEQFGQLAIGIAAFAILLVIAFLIMSQGKDQATGLISATSYSNETFTIVVDEWTTFTNCISNEAVSLNEVYNDTASNAQVNGTGNWTIDTNRVNFSNKDNSFYIFDTSINVTYDCKQPSAAYNSTVTLQEATDEVPGWTTVVVITFIGAVLLGMVAFFRRRSM